MKIFDQKSAILDNLTSKKRKDNFSGALSAKSNQLKKEIGDKFKKIYD